MLLIGLLGVVLLVIVLFVGCLDLFLRLIILFGLLLLLLIIVEMVVIFLRLHLLLFLFIIVVSEGILVDVILIVIVNCIGVVIVLLVPILVILSILVRVVLIVVVVLIIILLLVFLFFFLLLFLNFFINLICQSLGYFLFKAISFGNDPSLGSHATLPSIRLNFNNSVFLFGDIFPFLLDQSHPASSNFVIGLFCLIHAVFNVIEHMWLPTRVLERFKLFNLDTFLIRSHDHHRDLCIRHRPIFGGSHDAMFDPELENIRHFVKFARDT